MRLLICALLLLSLPAAARADEPRDWSVALPLFALSTSGLAVEGEHYLPGHRLSLSASLGFRAGGGDDYTATRLGGGAELRWFFWKRYRGAGPFLAGRLDLGWSHLAGIGDALTITESGLFGWRFVIKRRVTITPELGLYREQELPSGPIAAETRGGISVGLTVGWLL